MTVTATWLTPHFAARIDGADVTRPLDDAAWSAIRAALDEHSVLVFHGAPMDDETQIAFSRRFGALEVTRSMNPAAGTPFARQSNLDIRTGEVIPPDDRRMIYQLANRGWTFFSRVVPRGSAAAPANDVWISSPPPRVTTIFSTASRSRA